MKKLEKTQFLLDLYPVQCKPGNYIILAANDRSKKKGWNEIPLKYTNEKKLKRDLKRFFNDYPESIYDLYFCPVSYQNGKRRKAEVNPSKFLWQDIDEKEDLDALITGEHKPSIWWESSPNKYQGLWEMDNYLELEDMELINPWLSDQIGSDDCHDVGHVIRIPGTVNHKYNNTPRVKPANRTNKIYRKTKLIKESKKANKTTKSEAATGSISSDLDASKIISKYNIRGGLLDTLTANEATGDRSDMLWYLQNKLYEKGLEIPEIIFLIKSSVWNKYKGRPDEESRLLAEVEKVLLKAKEEGVPLTRLKNSASDGKPTIDNILKIQSFGDVMGTLDAPQGWLVEGFWGRRSHGIVAGQPKVFKSTFVQDLAVSVASGKPFLGEYKVHEPGPVLIVQNENTVGMIKDRNEKMMKHKGLVGKVDIHDRGSLAVKFPNELPIHYVNQSGFNFDDPNHLQFIEEQIAQIKPVLVIFDPLYLMFGGDINSAKDLQSVLFWLLQIKIKYKTAIILVHHYNKGQDSNRGGQKMLGSVTLHGWVESAWYMRRNTDKERLRDATDANLQIDEPSLVIMEREFRQAGSYPEIELAIKMGEYGTPGYEVSAEVYKEENLGQNDTSLSKQGLVKDTLYQAIKQSSIPLTKREWINSCSSEQLMGLSQKKVKDLIDELIQNKDVINLGVKGYMVNEDQDYVGSEEE